MITHMILGALVALAAMAVGAAVAIGVAWVMDRSPGFALIVAALAALALGAFIGSQYG